MAVPTPRTLAATAQAQAERALYVSAVLDMRDGEHRVTLPVVADSYVRNGSPNQNQGSEELLRIRSSGAPYARTQSLRSDCSRPCSPDDRPAHRPRRGHAGTAW